MATYEEIYGKRVKEFDSDPTLESSYEGQVWYDKSTGVLKSVVAIDAWSSSSNTINLRGSGYGFGTLTAGVTGLGEVGPPGNAPAATEEYNGSGWSTGNNYPRQDFLINACGTQTAGLAAGGYGTPASDEANEYNGTSWTAGGDLGTAKHSGGMFGIQTAGIYCGGDSAPPGYLVDTELYNGSSWSEQNSLPVAKRQFATAGTSTAGLISGGRIAPGPSINTTENWDGTNWTSGPNINTARRYLQGWGISTSALIAGGSPNGVAGSALTEMFDGTSWSETGDLATARHFSGTCQNQTSNTSGWLANGNAGPTYYKSTEEWSSSINVITNGAWASGGALPGSGRQGYGVGTGTQTATIAAGGPPTSTQNQFYDGSSWTNLASIPTGVTDSQGFGDTEELLMAGGGTAEPYASSTYVYSRPGDSWTAVSSPGNLNTGRGLGAGCGALSTAGIITGGTTDNSPLVLSNATENWNGSTWTSVNNLPTATGQGMGSCGTQTAGLAWSGQTASDPTAEETYEWDGTNWTSSGSRLTGVRAVRGGAGTQTAALTFGGWLDPGGSTATEGYDGTAWSTRPNMAGSAANHFQTGTQTAALRAGGTDGPGYTAVEEFTGEFGTVTASTLTTS